MDINGVIVFTQEIFNNQAFGLENLPKGIYHVRLGDSKNSQKLILE
jgi:hypothetical protein